jgi:oligopeptidase A
MATLEQAPSEVSSDNPLLQDTTLPAFDKIKAEHVVPGIRTLLTQLNADIDALEGDVQPTWEGLVEPLERVVDRLGRAWGAVSHLKAVKDTKELRDAVEEVQPERVKLSLRLGQSRALYEGFKALKDNSWGELNDAQRRIVDEQLRDFVHGGVALEGEQKERFNAIAEELSQLSTKFSNNLLDGTKAFKRMVTDKAEVDGLPQSALALAAQQAGAELKKGAGENGAAADGDSAGKEPTAEDGPWLFTLDIPSYMPIQSHAKNRALREELYRAYLTRASEGDVDNAPIIERVLALRQEKARLLGFDNFAQLSMDSKMATLDTAEGLMEELRAASWDSAQADLKEVQQFARDAGETVELRQWDIGFWAERLREAKYAITDEELRPYFSLPNVLEGVFGLAKRLFDVDVEAADGQAPIWHPDVRFFLVKAGGKPKAYFYLDPYSRPEEKRGGAWMDEVCGQSKQFAPPGQSVRLPVAHMVCNQTPPIGGAPSLMTFREVETLAHEFGHALQHMLTQVDEGLASGIRGIEWDAVELPSQFMENWCYERQCLFSFAKHHETGEPLPEELYQKLVAARTFRAGSMMMRQLHFSLLDLELHARYTPGDGKSVFDVDQALAKKTSVLPPLPFDRFLCGFAHIFAGGYSAGYFSYKWAEVLSADAYSAFEEAGLEDDEAVQVTGRRFRDTVLALGGSVAPSEVFKAFRGRDPSTEPLLRHSGLVPAAA